MAWIDDRLRDHPKINRASPNALKYWLFALTYCSQYGTNGQLEDAIRVIRIPTKYVAELVEIGLWDEDDDGLWVHDWQEHNDKRDEAIEQKRAAARERQQRHRAKARASRTERDKSRNVTRDKRDKTRDTKRDESVTVTRGAAPARATGARLTAARDHDQGEEDVDQEPVPEPEPHLTTTEPRLHHSNGTGTGSPEEDLEHLGPHAAGVLARTPRPGANT